MPLFLPFSLRHEISRHNLISMWYENRTVFMYKMLNLLLRASKFQNIFNVGSLHRFVWSMFTLTLVWFNNSSIGTAWLHVVKWEIWCMVYVSTEWFAFLLRILKAPGSIRMWCPQAKLNVVTILLYQVNNFSYFVAINIIVFCPPPQLIFSRRPLLGIAQNFLWTRDIELLHISRLCNCDECGLHFGALDLNFCLKIGCHDCFPETLKLNFKIVRSNRPR
jgi:hypothetical protein